MPEALTSETTLETCPSELRQQKQLALNAALDSQTFARADQLKCFLKYVCEMEIAGRGHELTEYRIGVEALGGPFIFHPAMIPRFAPAPLRSGKSCKSIMSTNSPTRLYALNCRKALTVRILSNTCLAAAASRRGRNRTSLRRLP